MTKDELNDNRITDVMAPMFAITMEFDAILSELLRDKFDMTLADFKVLRAVYMLETCTQLDIARFGQVTEAAVSKKIKSLVVDGLIQKKMSDTDKRKSVLSLTSKGKTLMKRLQVAVVGKTELMLTDFSKVNRKITTALLMEILGMIMEYSPRKDALTQSKNPILGQLKKCNINKP